MTDPSNQQRRLRAERLLIAYAAHTNRSGELAGRKLAEEFLTDMLADLMHHADALRLDFSASYRLAEMHFEAEIGGQP